MFEANKSSDAYQYQRYLTCHLDFLSLLNLSDYLDAFDSGCHKNKLVHVNYACRN